MGVQDEARPPSPSTFNTEGLLFALITHLPDPALMLHRETITAANDAASRIFDLTQPHDGSPFVRSEMLKIFLQTVENTSTGEWSPDEERVYQYHKIIAPSIDQDGTQLIVLRDIGQIRQLHRNQHEFIRIVSHDLRSPITSMQGFAAMLAGEMVGALNPRQHEFIDKILAGIDQITLLVDNIQDAGRFDPETGFYEMLRAPCDAGEIVERVVDTYIVPAEKSAISLHVHIQEALPILFADANMLERALTNLVDNAIKYTPNGGRVEVSAAADGDQMILSVSDTGYGIGVEDQKRLFQRHVRLANREHRRVKGSGLGLFIVRSVAQRHGGKVWVESAEGKGSQFYIQLPLTE